MVWYSMVWYMLIYTVLIFKGSSVAKSLLKTKNFLQDSEDFQEPFSWTSFNLYGCDTSIPVVEIRRHCAESSFQEAQKAVSERFACDSPCSEGLSSSYFVLTIKF